MDLIFEITKELLLNLLDMIMALGVCKTVALSVGPLTSTTSIIWEYVRNESSHPTPNLLKMKFQGWDPTKM